MKTTILLLLLTLPLLGLTQKEISMQDVEGLREVSMSDVNGQSTDGVYRYYAKGENQPFTGVLYSQHANGNIDSWQEYVDGVGQGKWINYYENGNLKEEGHYEQNRVQGPIRKYYADGTLKAEGTYKDWRIKIGIWKYYDQDGQLAYTKNYGEKGSIEEVEEYYSRGEISYSWYRNILRKNGFKLQSPIFSPARFCKPQQNVLKSPDLCVLSQAYTRNSGELPTVCNGLQNRASE